jgi:hypothetical protein
MRKRRDILFHVLHMQRIQQYVLALSFLTDTARHGEQDDREENEDAEYQTE